MFHAYGKQFDVIRTDDITSDDVPIFKVTVFDGVGRMIDVREYAERCIEHVKSRILEVEKSNAEKRHFLEIADSVSKGFAEGLEAVDERVVKAVENFANAATGKQTKERR